MSEDTIPYNGICDITKKMSNVSPVHIILCWKGTFRSGAITSGNKGTKGFIKSRNRSPLIFAIQHPVPARINKVVGGNQRLEMFPSRSGDMEKEWVN